MPPSPDFAELVRARLPLTPVPLVPEVRLHRAGPRSGLRRLAEADPDFGAPYWAYPWGGGMPLARYLLDHPQAVSGRQVLDLGTGSGLVGIAAAIAGAGAVLCIDVDPYAVAVAALNAEANGVLLEVMQADLLDGAPPGVHVILVGDLFYGAELASRVTRFLDRCLGAGIDVLVGDPWRTDLPRQRLTVLAEYAAPDFGDAAATARPVAVFRFLQTEAGA